MMLFMPRSVQITTPPASYEELVKPLRIPKARQRVLSARIQEAWKKMVAEDESLRGEISRVEEMSKSASAGR
jgi:hypothetical protein